MIIHNHSCATTKAGGWNFLLTWAVEKRGTLAISFCVEFHTTPHDVWKNEPNQVFFCLAYLHSIQLALLFSLLHPLAAGQRHQFTPGNARPFPPQCHWNPQWRNSSSFRGAPRCQFHRSQGKHRRIHKVGPGSDGYKWSFISPLINGLPPKNGTWGSHFAPI